MISENRCKLDGQNVIQHKPTRWTWTLQQPMSLNISIIFLIWLKTNINHIIYIYYIYTYLNPSLHFLLTFAESPFLPLIFRFSTILNFGDANPPATFTDPPPHLASYPKHTATDSQQQNLGFKLSSDPHWTYEILEFFVFFNVGILGHTYYSPQKNGGLLVVKPPNKLKTEK